MKKNNRYNPNPYNATHAAIAYLLFWAAMAVSSVAISSLVANVWAVERGDITPYLCLETVFVALSLLIVVFIVSGIAKANPLSGGGFLERKGLKTERLMAIVGVCGAAILFSPLAEQVSFDFGVLQSFFFENVSGGGIADYMQDSWLLYLYAFILVPLLPAVFEELLFRGVIMRGFSEWGKTTGVVLSAAAFALAHGNTDQLVYQFLFGLIVGFLVTETRCLSVGIVAHFTNNFFVQVFAIVTAIPSEWQGAEIYTSIVGIFSVFIGLACFVAALLYFGRRFLHSQKHSEKACPDVAAMFVEQDDVSGTVEKMQVWHQTGKRAERNENDVYFTTDGKNRIKLNRKSTTKKAMILTAVAFVLAVARIFLSFFGVL